jgi:8-oxo-dGTP pyrophosphatase MutT (NUDIX family)
MFRSNADASVQKVSKIKNQYLDLVDGRRAVNAFQWSKAKLTTDNPQGLAIVNRFEANSKFFRSFVPVLVGVSVVAIVKSQWELAVGTFVLLVLALWRYMEQRFKSTQQAYWAVLAVESAERSKQSANGESATPDLSEKSDRPTHAGGVVFKHTLLGKKVKYLLVQAKKDPECWVLPKGHIEPSEDALHCAVREVREETGVWARILVRKKAGQKEKQQVCLGTVEYTWEKEFVRCKFYLMKKEGSAIRHERRKRVWLALEEAISEATHHDHKQLLRRAVNNLD